MHICDVRMSAAKNTSPDDHRMVVRGSRRHMFALDRLVRPVHHQSVRGAARVTSRGLLQIVSAREDNSNASRVWPSFDIVTDRLVSTSATSVLFFPGFVHELQGPVRKGLEPRSTDPDCSATGRIAKARARRSDVEDRRHATMSQWPGLVLAAGFLDIAERRTYDREIEDSRRDTNVIRPEMPLVDFQGVFVVRVRARAYSPSANRLAATSFRCVATAR